MKQKKQPTYVVEVVAIISKTNFKLLKMTNNSTPREIFYVEDLLNELRKSTYYDISLFSYDYDTKRILYDGKSFQPTKQSPKFNIANNIRCRWKIMQHAAYVIATDNTPEPEEKYDALTEAIDNWLTTNNKTKVTILEVMKEALHMKTIDTTRKAVEMQVAQRLKNLGWVKKNSAGKRFWAKTVPINLMDQTESC